jgi:hypothetical protein
MQFGMVPNAQGHPRPKIAVMTYPWFVEELTVPEGALWLSISAFSDSKEWIPVIETTERLKIAVRAERSGVLVARSH